MSASTAFVTLMTAATGVTNIIGVGAACKLYPDAIPVDVQLPAIAYTISVDPIATIHGAVLGEDTTITIACWAVTRAKAEELATAVQAALIVAKRVWSNRTTAFDEETASYASIVTLDWL
jgi:hypothetical protein